MLVALARAWMTASMVDFSKSAAPFTVLTKLGIRSLRRWYCASTFAHLLFTFSRVLISPLYNPTSHSTMTAMMIQGRYLLKFIVIRFRIYDYYLFFEVKSFSNHSSSFG